MTKQRALRLKAWLLTLCMVISLVPTAAFAEGNKTLKYVSLGDSMSNGYGLDGYNEDKSGYGSYGTDAYPNQFELWLEGGGYNETEYDVDHSRLAMSGMRAEDLRFLLDDNYAGDKYTHTSFTDRLTKAGLTVDVAADVYQAAVENADLISLAIGNANFGSFLMENITNAFGVFGGKPADSKWMENALTGCDDAMKEKLQALMDTLSAKLTAQLSSLGEETAEVMVDAILYTVVSYLVNYAGVLDAIVELNPDAKVILVGIMDTTSGMQVSFEVAGKTQTVALSTVLKLLVEPINTYMTTLPAMLQAEGKYEDATFYYAAAPTVECLVDTFSRDMFEGELTAEEELTRKRFHKEIVGTDEDNLSFIWKMAGDMLAGQMSLPKGITVTLGYVSLDQVKAYETALEAALENNNVTDLQTNYIDPILKIMGDGEISNSDKTTAQNTINELLSAAFYLSLEAAVLEASDGAKWGEFDTSALTALTGGLESVFGDVKDAVLGSIDDVLGDEYAEYIGKINTTIYGLVADVAEEMISEKAKEIYNDKVANNEKFKETGLVKELGAEITVTIDDTMIKKLLAGNKEDATEQEKAAADEVYFDLIAQIIKQMLDLGKDENGNDLELTADEIGDLYQKDEIPDDLFIVAAKKANEKDIEGVMLGEVTIDGKQGLKKEHIEKLYAFAKADAETPEDKKETDSDYQAKKKAAYDIYYIVMAAVAEKMEYNLPEGDEDIKYIIENGEPNSNVFVAAINSVLDETINSDVIGTINGLESFDPFKLGDLEIHEGENKQEKQMQATDLEAIYWYAKNNTSADEAAAFAVYYALVEKIAANTITEKFGGGATLTSGDIQALYEANAPTQKLYELTAGKLNEKLFGDDVPEEESEKILTDDVMAIYNDNSETVEEMSAAAKTAYNKIVAAKAEDYDIEGLTPAMVVTLLGGDPVGPLYVKAANEVNTREDLSGAFALLDTELAAIYADYERNDGINSELAVDAYAKLMAHEKPSLSVDEAEFILTGTKEGYKATTYTYLYQEMASQMADDSSLPETLNEGEIETIYKAPDSEEAYDAYYRVAEAIIASGAESEELEKYDFAASYGFTAEQIEQIYEGTNYDALYQFVADTLGVDVADVERYAETDDEDLTPVELAVKAQVMPKIEEVQDDITDGIESVKSEACKAVADAMTKAFETVAKVVNGDPDGETDDDENGLRKTIADGVDEAITEFNTKYNEAIYGDKTIDPPEKDQEAYDGIRTTVKKGIDEAIDTIASAVENAETKVNEKVVEGVDDKVTEVYNLFMDNIYGRDADPENSVEAVEGVNEMLLNGISEPTNLIKDAVGTAKSTVANADINTYFDMLQKLFAMDELVPEAAAENKTLMNILHLFSRMLIGNGLGAHPSADGHAKIFAAMKEAETVQKKLQKDVGMLMVGMGGLLVTFGADILGIALNSDTIQSYINDLPAAAEALYNAVIEKLGTYEQSEAALNTAIDKLEGKLNDLTDILNTLSENFGKSQNELSQKLSLTLNEMSGYNGLVTDTIIGNLEDVSGDLALLMTAVANEIKNTEDELEAARVQLGEFGDLKKDLEAAADALKTDANDLSDLLTKVELNVTAFEHAYTAARKAMTEGIDAVANAYDAAETKLSQIEGHVATATGLAEKVYDSTYEVLTKAYNTLPADLALVMFGVVAGSSYMTLTITEITLKDFAQDQINKNSAELAAKEKQLQDLKDLLNEMDENSAAAQTLRDEINALKSELTALEADVAAENAELQRMIDEGTEEDMAKLRADYQNLVSSIIDGGRSEIVSAMEAVADSGVKAFCSTITSTVKAFRTGIRYINEKIHNVVRESRDVYGSTLSQNYSITDNSYYVALGDDVAAANSSYVELLKVARTTTKTRDIPTVKNLADPNVSIVDVADRILTDAEYSEPIKAADLITVGYGNTSFGKKAMDHANNVKKQLDGDNTVVVEDFDWEGYIGKAGAAYVADTMADIKNSLKASDLGENNPEAVAAAIEAFAFYSVEYLCNMPAVINAIRELNNQAVVVIVGMYNPLKDLAPLTYGEGDDEMTIDMGGYLGNLVDAMDLYGRCYAILASRTKQAVFVETPDVDVDAVSEDVTTLTGFMAQCLGGGINVMPTAGGQKDIRDYVLGGLNITSGAIGITGNVTIKEADPDGKAMYGEELYIDYDNEEITNANLRYEWYRGGELIEGATGKDYLLTGADVDKEITAKVVGINQYWGEISSKNSMTVVVAPYPYAEHGTVEIPYGDLISDELWGEDDTGWSWDVDDALYDEPLGEAGSFADRMAIYDPALTGKDTVTEDGVTYSVYGPVKVKVLVEVVMSDLPVDALYNAPTALEGLVYNGNDQDLIEGGYVNSAFTEHVSIKYAIGTSSEKAPELADNEWLTEIPQGKNAGTYYVWYYVNGGINYPSTKECIPVTIKKADLDPADYTIPTGLTATVGQTLADVVGLPTGWAWVDPTTSVGDKGEKTFPAMYDPDAPNGPDNHNAVTVDVTITVSEAVTTPTVVNLTLVEDEDLYAFSADGKTLTIYVGAHPEACVVIVTNPDDSYTVLPAVENAAGDYDFDISAIPAGATITIAVKGDADGSGAVTLSDAALVSRSLLSTAHPAYKALTEIYMCISDVDGTGEVTMSDAAFVSRHLLSSEHPAQKKLTW